MLLVFVFMFVLLLIERARNPDLYQWIWTTDQAPPQQVKETENRTPSGADSEEPSLDRLDWQGATQRADQSYQNTQRDLWETLTASLTSAERSLFDRLLKSSRDGSILQTETLSACQPVINKMDSGWNRYHEKAFLEVTKFNTDLTDSQKKTWLDVLQRSKDFWEGPLTASFQATLDKKDLAPDQQQTLMQVQSILDQLALKEIRDNTLFRSSEHTIWFRLLEKLIQASPNQIKQSSTAQVNFLQLDSQGSEYRGKLVTVSGEIRQGYRVRAPKNILGITQYSVFTVKPHSGPEQPVIIYCLETPAGFPALPDKDLDRRTATLREKASFTGFFFKSWVYKTDTSTFSAPLMLAKSPQWSAAPTVKETPPATVNTGKITLMVTGITLGAILFSLFVYWQSRWKNQPAVTRHMDQEAEATLHQIPSDEIGLATLDALRELEEEATSDDTPTEENNPGEKRGS